MKAHFVALLCISVFQSNMLQLLLLVVALVEYTIIYKLRKQQQAPHIN